MDDLSKLQKISNLARELMRHGQAPTMDLAMKMAKQQLESGNVAEYVPSSTPATSVQPAAPLPEVSEQIVMPRQEGVPNDEIMHAVEKLVSDQQTVLSRMTNVVNSHTNQFQSLNNKTNELGAHMTGIIAEITSLKQEISRLKENPVTQPLKPKELKVGQTQFKEPSASSQGGDGHARTGKYNPDDVSIEKFFYYGGGVTKK